MPAQVSVRAWDRDSEEWVTVLARRFPALAERLADMYEEF